MEFLAKHLIRSTIVLILLISVFGCSEEEDTGAASVAPGNDTNEEFVAPIDPEISTLGKKQVIIDNKVNENTNKPKRDDRGYLQEGVWEQSTLTGRKNSISRYSSDPTAKVTYQTEKLGPQKYCVSVYRVTHSNSIDRAHYEVFDSGLSLGSVIVDHRFDSNQSGWHHLGEFQFTGTDGEVVLSRDANANNGYLRADAIRFKRLKEGHDCLGKTFKTVKKNGVIDNRHDPSVEKPKKDDHGYREQGTWEKSSLPGFKGRISRYSDDANASVSYTAKVEAREYCLAVYRVTHPNSVDEADIAISQNNTLLDTISMNFKFQVNQSGWVALGRYQFNQDDMVKLTITRGNGAQGVLRADAIRFSSNMKLCD